MHTSRRVRVGLAGLALGTLVLVAIGWLAVRSGDVRSVAVQARQEPPSETSNYHVPQRVLVLTSGGRDWPLIFEDGVPERKQRETAIVADLQAILGRYPVHTVIESPNASGKRFVIGGERHPARGLVDWSGNERYSLPRGMAKHWGFIVDLPEKGRCLVVPKELQILFSERELVVDRYEGARPSLPTMLERLRTSSADELAARAEDWFRPTMPHEPHELTQFARQFRLIRWVAPAVLQFSESDTLGGLCVEVESEWESGPERRNQGLLLCWSVGKWQIVL